MLNLLLAYITGLLIARYLGPEDYGSYSFIISLGTIFLVFVSLGLPQVVLRELAKDTSKDKHILGGGIVLSFTSAIIIVFGLVLTIWLTNILSQTEKVFLSIYCLRLMTTAFRNFHIFNQAKLRGGSVAIIEISQSLVTLSLTIVCIALNGPIWLLLFINACEPVFIAVGNGFLFLKKGFPPIDFRPHFVWKTLLKDSLPYILTGSVVIIYQRVDQVMLRYLSETINVGYYASSAKLTEMASMVPTVIGVALFPIMVKKCEADPDSPFVGRFFDIVIWTAVPITVFLLVFAKKIVLVLYGDAYLPAVSALQIMVWKGVVRGIDASISQWALLKNLQRYLPIRQVWGGIINVILNFLLIPRYGISGAALATIASVVLVLVATGFVKELRPSIGLAVKSLLLGPYRLTGELIGFVKSKI